MAENKPSWLERSIKFEITQIDKEVFFLKKGLKIYVDYEGGRIYAEDMKQYCPLDLVMKLNMDGKQVE